MLGSCIYCDAGRGYLISSVCGMHACIQLFDFELRARVTRRKIYRRCQIAFLINIKNARVLTVTVKIDQSEGIPESGIPEMFTGVHSPPLPNPHTYHSLATLRASRVFSRRSPTLRTPGTGYKHIDIQKVSKTLAQQSFVICQRRGQASCEQ